MQLSGWYIHMSASLVSVYIPGMHPFYLTRNRTAGEVPSNCYPSHVPDMHICLRVSRAALQTALPLMKEPCSRAVMSHLSRIAANTVPILCFRAYCIFNALVFVVHHSGDLLLFCNCSSKNKI